MNDPPRKGHNRWTSAGGGYVILGTCARYSVVAILVSAAANITEACDECRNRQMKKRSYAVQDYLAARNIAMDDLVKRIKTVVAPESWEDVGGLGTVTLDKDSVLLHVTNSTHVHDTLHDTLILQPAKEQTCRAIAKHDLAAIIEAITEHKELLSCSYGMTCFGQYVANASLLHVAAADGNPATVRYLLHLGAKTNVKDSEDRTPLFYSRNARIARALIGTQKDVPAKDAYRRTPLFYARNANLVDLYVAFGLDWKQRDFSGNAPIHLAARLDSVRSAERLLRLGADANMANTDARTALLEACAHGSSRVALALLAAGADAHRSEKLGYGALHLAVQGFCKDRVLKKLLRAGVPTSSQDNRLRESPLHVAARVGNPQAARFLIANGINIHEINKEGKTALEVAGQIQEYAANQIQTDDYVLKFSCSTMGPSGWLDQAKRKLAVFRVIAETVR